MYAKIVDIRWDKSGFLYLVLHLWRSRADFDAAQPPAEIQDFRMQLPAKNATEQTPRKSGALYVRLDAGTWTQAELDAEITAWHRGQRSDPRADLVYDSVPVNHAAIIAANIERYIQHWKAAPMSGDKRDLTLVLVAKDEPGGIVDKPAVKALVGLGIER